MEIGRDLIQRAVNRAADSGFARSARAWYKGLRPAQDENGQYLIGPDLASFYAADSGDRVDFFRALAMTVADHAIPRGQLLQDVAALAFSDQRNTYLEVGGGHPRNLSNTFMLEKSYGWEGLVVEPNPEFNHLYGEVRPSLKGLIRACVVPQEYAGDSAQLILARELSQVVGLESANPDTHQAHRDMSRKAGRVVSAPVIRPTELWDTVLSHLPQGVSFLSIDIEGAEFEVLTASPLSSDIAPAFISVETNNDVEREARVTDYLVEMGYSPVLAECTRWDRWFRKSSA